jgi:hypothetical protein
MATFYNKIVRNIDENAEAVFTSSSDSTIILSILTVNTDGSNPADVTLQQLNSSSAIEAYIAFSIPVPNNSNLDLISNKYILPSGKALEVLASASGKLDLTVSYVEV